MTINTIIAVAAGYLLGSIPSAYIAGRLKKGIDIRQAGSGNVGALNVIREVGSAAGFTVLAADMAKGAAAVSIARWLGLPMIWVLVAGLAAVAGHNWPVFLRFRGGKGAATVMGVLLALVPVEFLLSFAIITIAVIITGNPTLGFSVGMASLPLIIWQLNGSGMLIVYSMALAALVGIRHFPALKRALASAGSKREFIFDSRYHFWQARKKK